MAKRKTKAQRDQIEKDNLREFMYATLKACNSGYSIDDDLLSDIPQATGADVWIRWLMFMDDRWALWSFTEPPTEGYHFGGFLLSDLLSVVSFDATVDKLFEAGVRA